MLSWRARRQLVVIVILLIFFGGIALYGIWRVIPVPSCTDGKKNQGELEIDCGGPCGPCELKHPQAIEKFWVRAVPIGETRYDLAAEIRNPNEVLSSARLQYEFILADGFGIIGRKPGETYIYPQERMHIVEANVEAGRPPSRIEFKITDAQWQYQKAESPNLVVERQDYRVTDEGKLKKSEVEVSILNRSLQDFRQAEVKFILLDQDGNLIGANRTVVDNLHSGEHKLIKSIWPREFAKAPATIVVEPRVNIFDPAVILKP